MSTRFARAFAALAVIAVTVSGCAGSPDLEPAPSPTHEAAPPVDTASPTPTPTPYVPDCLNIISSETEATLTAEGFVLIEEHESKLRVEQRVEAMFFDNGGVDCLWGVAGGGDSLVAFGYSPITPADAATAQQKLAAGGYAQTEEGTDIVLSIDPKTDAMGIGDVFVFSGAEWFHATTREAITEIRESVETQKPTE